jgi:hypothetical protein
VYTVAVRSDVETVLVADEAVTAPVFFFLRFILRLESSSEEEYAEESLSLLAGGGVAGRFRKLDLDFTERFLKSATGSADGAIASVESIALEALRI